MFRNDLNNSSFRILQKQGEETYLTQTQRPRRAMQRRNSTGRNESFNYFPQQTNTGLRSKDDDTIGEGRGKGRGRVEEIEAPYMTLRK